MPECNECGNTESFVHVVTGTQTLRYDADGTYQGLSDEDLDTQEVFCNECESYNVEVA